MKTPIQLGSWYKIIYGPFYIQPLQCTTNSNKWANFIGNSIVKYDKWEYQHNRSFYITSNDSIQLVSDEEINNIKVSLL